MAFDPISLWSAAFGIGGMLAGGFLTYHQVNFKLQELETKIKTVSDKLDSAEDRFISTTLCEAMRRAVETHMEQQDVRMDRIDAQFTEVFRKLDVIRDILANKADR
jgi:hypothetical protein